MDFILDLSFDSRDTDIEELLQARLFLTATSGSSSVEINGTTTVSAFFYSAHDRAEAIRELSDIEQLEMTIVDRDRVDWLEMYEQSLEPILIGQRFVVAPDAKLIAENDERLRIIVPQEQAFGTGSH
ncbi:MAG TPA: 50S ribosomal protein L11 methyltransferase, partial [Thermoanaerobaculia bacterium]|nr:50S ribosomal protein L11 methyltransferase [Thermoanaerobaculia bacterium]